MKLNGNQKKFIKKHVRDLSVEEISAKLKVEKKLVEEHLRERWGDDKFNQVVRKIIPKKWNLDELVKEFSFRKFFRKNWWVFLTLILLVIITYANAFTADFVSDDIPGISNNPKVGDYQPNLYHLFTFSYVRTNMLALIYHLFGLVPFYFRIFSVIFHIGTVLILFTLLGFLFEVRIAIIAAALFAVHPMLVEAITWISGGPYAMYSFFVVFSLLFYILSRKSKYYMTASLAMALMAYTVSPLSVVIPIVFSAFELAFGDLKKHWTKLVPFYAFSLIWGSIQLGQVGTRSAALQSNFYVQDGHENPLLQIPIAISSYVELFIWPNMLTIYHSEMTFTPLVFSLKAIFTITYLTSLIYFYRKNKYLFFWLSLFIIALLPTLTPLRVSWIVAERYSYLSMLGLAAVMAYFLFWILKKFGNYEKYGWIMIVIIVFSYSVRSIVRNKDWRSEDNLWTATAVTSPSSPNTHINMGDVYSRHGEYQKAADEFARAIEINPKYADAYHNIGITYIALGRMEEAISALETGITVNPRLWQSHLVLADINLQNNNVIKAKEYVERAIVSSPDVPELRSALEIVNSRL